MIAGNSVPRVLFYSTPAARKSREGQGRVGEDPGNKIESQAGCVVEIRGRFVRESSSDTTLTQIITCNIWIKQKRFYFLNNFSANNNNNTLNS